MNTPEQAWSLTGIRRCGSDASAAMLRAAPPQPRAQYLVATAVFDALGKKRGSEDHRTQDQRYHDALYEACRLLIGAKMVLDRAGADT